MNAWLHHQQCRFMRPDGGRYLRPDHRRLIAKYLGRNAGPVADIFFGALDGIEWLEKYEDHIRAAKDPPKSMRELQAGVGKARPGYDDHHIIKQTAAER